MQFINKLPTWLKSKYLITGAVFITWMFFFDRNDITLQYKRLHELNQLQASERNINQQINETRTELLMLKTNPATLEKYAREKYMMKKENEDLFIVNSSGDVKK
ncbi:MAG: septum formation initiator family protein [Chitinophagaceae bacterium]